MLVLVKYRFVPLLTFSLYVSLPSESQSAEAASPRLWRARCLFWMWVWKVTGLAWLPSLGSSILGSLGRLLTYWAHPHLRGCGRWCCPSSRAASVLVAAPLGPLPPTEEVESCWLESEEPRWSVRTERRICGWEKWAMPLVKVYTLDLERLDLTWQSTWWESLDLKCIA